MTDEVAPNAYTSEQLALSLWGRLPELFGVADKLEAEEEPSDPATVAFANAAYALTESVWRVLNVQTLRQKLGEIALSKEYAAFELGLFSQVLQAGFSDDAKTPLVLRPRIVSRLGRPTADLLREAIAIARTTFEVVAPALTIALQTEAPPDAETLSLFRHDVVLGDLLPTSVAELLLASLRGTVALFALFAAACGECERLPEWKGVALGEIALKGMQTGQVFVLPSEDRIDLQAAAAEHAAHKASTFHRLQFAPPSEIVPTVVEALLAVLAIAFWYWIILYWVSVQ